MKHSTNNSDDFRLIKNFLYEYSLDDSQRMLDLIYKRLEKSLKRADESEREEIMSFFESLEEMIPALYPSSQIDTSM